ncbi:tripartite tricarboxylate transporter substrate binding protein [Variovorax sp. J22R24]|uniref:Bug family tripartite tricarboxylate transporter substrate binding protein n=1 Tax=Variovorax gracilis TaxID=3053502 RepID=UPI0025788C68|nr:tripartite tricarboxylate transporter substrate binding protein [Variovorax sp. J22R24]MDM0109007.1 tripartite tricarboxylate transporter substrate binding protein [Variovorax sp. J22R24]
MVGFPPGGPTDGMARVLADPLREWLRSPVVVENRTGASGRIAVSAAARAPVAGRTLLLSPGATLTIQPHLYPDLPGDPVKLLVPIALLGVTDLSVVVAADHPAEDIQGLMRWFRQNPALATCGTAGVGTVAHLAMVELGSRTGTDVRPVHYRGALEEMAALVEGSLKAAAVIPWMALPFKQAGKVRVLATTGTSRSPLLADVPTMRECGIDLVAREWAGLFAPAGTPPEAIARFGDAARSALVTPSVRASFAKYGLETGTAVLGEFAALVTADYDRWGQTVRRGGIKAES